MRSTPVSPATLFRLGGVSLLVGGLIGTIALTVHPDRIDDPLSAPVHLALYSAVICSLLGLPALIARQAERSGITAVIGGVLLFFGLAFEDPLHSVLAFTVVPVISANPGAQSLLNSQPPALGILQTLALVAIAIGLALVVATTLRSPVPARWPAIVWLLALIALLGSFVVPPLRTVGPVLLYLGLASFGVALLSEADPVRQSAAMPVRGMPAS
jgi:hypothetical protein